MIDDGQPHLLLGDAGGDLLDLAGAKQRCRSRGDDGHDLGRTHVEVDRPGKADRLGETILDRARRRFDERPIAVGAALRALVSPLGHQHDGTHGHKPAPDGATTPARGLCGSLGLRDGYPCWGSACSESIRCTGAPGIMVDMACL